MITSWKTAILTFLVGVGMALKTGATIVNDILRKKKIAKAQEKAARNALFPADSFLRDFKPKADTDNSTDTK